MNKAELISAIAHEAGITKADAAPIVEAVFSTIVANVAANEEVSIAGFGKFIPKARDERDARNPRTGETVSVAATVIPKFTAAKAFKEEVAEAAAAAKPKKAVKKPAAAAKPAAKPAAKVVAAKVTPKAAVKPVAAVVKPAAKPVKEAAPAQKRSRAK